MNATLNPETVKGLDLATLFFVRADLTATVAAQEGIARAHGDNAAPKLGRYTDELHAVAGEIRRRQNSVG